MHKTNHSIKIKEPLIALATFIISLILWQLLDWIFSIRAIVLPSPVEIVACMFDNWHLLLAETLITVIEAVAGFFFGSLSAFLVAVLFVYSRTLKTAFYPYAIGLKAVPLYALAPILALWFGTGLLDKIILSALVSFFPVLVAGVTGLSSIKEDELTLMKLMGSSKWQELTMLRFPKSLPFIFPALKISTTLSVVGAVIAEFTGSSRGLGHLIVNASYYLDTSLMFSGIISVSIIGMAFFGVIAFIEKKVIFWS